MAMATIGGLTSGNSSVCRLASATMPKMTSASVTTIVRTGRLIAESEINNESFLELNRSARRNGLRRATQQCIPCGKLPSNHRALCEVVAQSKGNIHALRNTVTNAQHPDATFSHDHGIVRYDRPLLRTSNDASIGKQPGF